MNMAVFIGGIKLLTHRKGITLDEAPESTIQLCTFLLKISKVSKKGGVPLLLGFGWFGQGVESKLLF